MRANPQIRRIPQRMIPRQRFRIRNINRSTTQAPILQRRNQRLLDQDLAARDVGHIRLAERVVAVLGQEGEFGRANEMRGLRGEREADYQVVQAQGQEGVDGCLVCAVVPGDGDRAVCVAGAGDDVVGVAARGGCWARGGRVGVDGHS